MTWQVLRRFLLLGPVVLTIPLPLIYGWRTLRDVTGNRGSTDELFIAGLGLFARATVGLAVRPTSAGIWLIEREAQLPP